MGYKSFLSILELERKDGGSTSPDVCRWLPFIFSSAQKFTMAGLTYIRQQIKLAMYPNSNIGYKIF